VNGDSVHAGKRQRLDDDHTATGTTASLDQNDMSVVPESKVCDD